MKQKIKKNGFYNARKIKDLWDIIKKSNIYVIVASEKGGTGRKSNTQYGKNFPKTMKDANPQI